MTAKPTVNLSTTYEYVGSDKDEKEMKNLIEVIWNHIQDLTIPDVSGYKESISESRVFIVELLREEL